MIKSTVIANQVAVIGAGITGLLVAQGLRKVRCIQKYVREGYSYPDRTVSMW